MTKVITQGITNRYYFGNVVAQRRILMASGAKPEAIKKMEKRVKRFYNDTSKYNQSNTRDKR